MKKIKRLSLFDALTQGVIDAISYDFENHLVICFSEGSLFGKYSSSYYHRMFNRLLMPIPLNVYPLGTISIFYD